MSAALLIKGVKFAAALGVTKVFSDVIKTNTITETTIQKLGVNIGSFVLGSMLIDHASKHVDNVIKTITEDIEKEEQKEDNKPKEVDSKEKAP